MLYRQHRVGSAKLTCSEYKVVPSVRDFGGHEDEMRNVLCSLAEDFGLRPTEANILKLIELFFWGRFCLQRGKASLASSGRPYLGGRIKI